jgi:hypothetical protein
MNHGGLMLKVHTNAARVGKRRRRRSGQTMIEYIIVFVALFATILSLSVFLYALRQQSNRTLGFVASDYP